MSGRSIVTRFRALGALSFLLLAFMGTDAPRAEAEEQAWVRGGIRLNVRADAGTKYKILGVITTGDPVTVVSRTEEWTEVRTQEGVTGWIPVGYLQPDAPPTLKVQQLEGETSELSSKVQQLANELKQLRANRDSLVDESNRKQAEVERLTAANLRMKTGSRNREWMTGAGILAGGMVAGAFLRGSSGRRQSTRIRL